MIEYSDFYWKHNDFLNKDTSLAHGFGEEVWNHQQAKIDCMQVRLDGANERALSILNHKNVMVDKMQAEIDELQAKAQMCRDEKTHAISRWSALCKERDELQARVDKLIPLLENCDYLGWVEILNGEEK